MRKAKDKAHLVFWILGIFLIAFQVLLTIVRPDSTLDINIYDTYYVMAYTHLFHVLGVWSILCGFGYWVLKLRRIEIIGWMFLLHLIFTVLFPLSFATSHIDINPTMDNYKLIQYFESLWFFGMILFVIGQILYFLNILSSAIRKLKSR